MTQHASNKAVESAPPLKPITSGVFGDGSEAGLGLEVDSGQVT